MYYRHFGLDGAPFRFVPSPRELFLSQSHREGLAALEWGVLHEPSGFTVLIGEAGAGKTTLVKSILARNHARVPTMRALKNYGCSPMVAARRKNSFISCSSANPN